MADRPNILMVMCDQLSALATSPYGNSEVLTPHLDALANRGTTFLNAYCNAPLCAPSRASLFTGRLSASIPVNDNAEELPASFPTFAFHLREAGYHTVLSGKMHFVGPDQYHGLEERLTTDIYPADFSFGISWAAQGDPPRKFGARSVVAGTPESCLPQMAEMVRAAGPLPSTYQLEYDEETQFKAIERLRQFSRRRGVAARKPWFLCVSFTQPHDPYAPATEYWDRYASIEIAPPAPAPPGHVPHRSDVWVNSWHGVDLVAPTTEEIVRMRRGYYGMTSFVDDKLAELLAELERLGYADDTVVLFTSDHGDMLGEHGMFFKRTMREWSTRVPLLAAGPGISEGARISSEVSLVDLYPTLLELAGVPLPDLAFCRELDGSSLVELLRGVDAAADLRQPVVIESNGEGTISPIRTVVVERMKYIAVHGQREQLYDLRSDPDEWHDVSSDTGYEDVLERLRNLCVKGWDPEDQQRRVIESQERRVFLKRALFSGRFQPWDLDPYHDGSRSYVRHQYDVGWNRSSEVQSDPLLGGR